MRDKNDLDKLKILNKSSFYCKYMINLIKKKQHKKAYNITKILVTIVIFIHFFLLLLFDAILFILRSNQKLI